MTDSQIIKGIQDNNPLVWRYISRNLKSPFIATLKQFSISATFTFDEWEDIFQDTCIVLLEKIKAGKFESKEDSSLFSYFVEIGKNTMWSASRKKAKHHPVIKAEAEGPHVIRLWPGKSANQEGEGSPAQEVTTEEKQTQQDEFLDRVFDSLTESCKMLLKKFYWEHKPMDEIASILHLGNANSAKTKKNRCMNQFKDIAKKLIENDEFAEEVVRACVERAALRELLGDERIVMNDPSIKIAALEVDEDKDNTEDK